MTWATQLIRIISTVSSRVAGSNPRPICSASHGAAMKIRTLAIAMTVTAPVSTVRPKSLATRSSPVSWRRLLKIGTNGAVSPAATRTSRTISGIRNAAL